MAGQAAGELLLESDRLDIKCTAFINRLIPVQNKRREKEVSVACLS